MAHPLRPHRATRPRHVQLAGTVLFLTALALVLLSPGASAHAVLVTAEPAPNSQLQSAPEQLVLSFSEEVADQYTTVRVLDDEGTDHAEDVRISSDGLSITVTLGTVPDAVYTIHWQTLSRDTHTVKGQYLLAIGVRFDETPTSSAPVIDIPELPTERANLEIAARGLAFLGIIAGAGIPLAARVLGPAADVDARQIRVRRFSVIALGIGAFASLVLVHLIGLRIGNGLIDGLGTEGGRWIGIRVALAVWLIERTGRGFGELGADDTRARATRHAALAVATIASISFAGHAAAEPHLTWLAVTNDILHLTAAALWIGGLVIVHDATRADRPHDAGLDIVRRFHPWAVATVLVIIVTGTFAALSRGTTPDSLTANIYGRALATKVLLLVPLVALGAYNRYRLGALARKGAAYAGHLRRSTGLEAVLMVVIVAAAGVMATAAPPDSLAEPTQAGVGTPPPPAIATFSFDGYDAVLRASPDPFTVGPQNLTLRLTPTVDDPPAVHEAYLVLRSPSAGVSSEGDPRQMLRVDDHTFRITGFIMTETGTWHNDLLLQGPGLFHEAHTPFYVHPAGGPGANGNQTNDA